MFQGEHGSTVPLPVFPPVGDRMRLLYDDPGAVLRLHAGLKHVLTAAAGGDPHRPVTCLCIGTDRSTGDSLGPLVGSFLVEQGVSPRRVWGTLDQPVHATNLKGVLHRLETSPEDPILLAVDACLGRLENVGAITFGLGPLRPGAGVNKDLPQAGHAHVMGTVNAGGFMEYFVLQNTRLSLVMAMARTIAHALAPLLESGSSD